MSRHHRAHRLSGRRWERLRRMVLDRDGWRCRSCGRAGRLEVDHIEALHLGGDPWDPDNLQSLCGGCHVAKTRSERLRGTETPERAAWAAFMADRWPQNVPDGRQDAAGRP
ncbi:MAG: HNH endonuclease [Caldilineaceae bacterium SB0668_bin_21]|nr:HNH endonuclease [Caldilineaceae bacterium SB0668_bin_21]MXX24375.1 HNH endonuclease [Caldilineaceae bacterium SB0668_bin_21]